MSNFAKNLKDATSFTTTENGMLCRDTTGGAVLDLFAVIGALRNADENRITRLYDNAVADNKLLATKTVFYGRDVREGLGERNTFRILLNRAATYYPETVRPNIALIGLYGRYDDLYALIGTKVEDEMWAYMKAQFDKDLANMKEKKPVSLLAKWIKTPDASSDKTRKMGILTSQKLGYKNVGLFKKDLKALRRYLDIVEIKISANNFDTIAYDKVPAKAMRMYRKLFNNKDNTRFTAYLDAVEKGDAKINASVVTPGELVGDICKGSDDRTTEAQWKALPNYVDDDTNVLVVCDTSGSMGSLNGSYWDDNTPIYNALGLSIYFAERNKGDFANMFITFSSHPKLQTISGPTLKSKIKNFNRNGWESNTDIDAVFRLILDTAVKNHTPANELPKAICIISDMEFDDCADMRTDFASYWRGKFASNGYEIPNIVFWNVESRNDTYHVDKNGNNVQIFSGSSTNTFKSVLSCLNCTPYEAMMKVLSSDRYEPITVE